MILQLDTANLTHSRTHNEHVYSLDASDLHGRSIFGQLTGIQLLAGESVSPTFWDADFEMIQDSEGDPLYWTCSIPSPKFEHVTITLVIFND